MTTPAPHPRLLTVGRYAGVATNCQVITLSGQANHPEGRVTVSLL